MKDVKETRGRGPKHEQRGKGRETGHPPIIITDDTIGPDPFEAKQTVTPATGRDVLVGFDGEGSHIHYRPEEPPTYTASSLDEIDSIKVEDDRLAGHTCINTPGKYLVVVSKQRNDAGGGQSRIEIDARGDEGIVIRFPDGEYHHEHQPNTRKKLRGALKKIRSLKVFDASGEVHDCEIAKSGKNVRITIRD